MHIHAPLKLAQLLKLTCFAILIFSVSTANAQRRRTAGINADGDLLGGSNHSSSSSVTASEDAWTVAVNAGYESPLGELKDVYKGAPTFGVTVGRRMGSLLYSGTVDYRSYKPKQDTFDYSYDGTNTVQATYSNYNGIGLYLGVAYQLSLGQLNVYGGVNGGIVLTKYGMTIGDGSTISGSVSASTSVTYIGPKIGFNVPISGNVSLGIEGRYSLGTVGANYNTREGGSTTPGFNSYAGNAFLTYSF